jgi:mRNA interferase RelE/StbE
MNGRQYQIEYGESALADLEKIPKDSFGASRPNPSEDRGRLETGLHGDVKRLRNADVAYRLRMGVYRVLFDLERDTIIIRRIGHRKEIYD